MKSGDKVRVVSLFSGIGGFERGLDFAEIPYETVFASEIDAFARTTYLTNFAPLELTGDITKISEEQVPEHDFLVAGFPCQAFSIAGKRRGFEDARGTLFFDILRILKYRRPKYFLLENVKNLVSHDQSRTMRVILESLAGIGMDGVGAGGSDGGDVRDVCDGASTDGYAIDFTVINACEAGAPQNRERTYIVGVRGGKREKFAPDLRNARIDRLKRELNNDGLSSGKGGARAGSIRAGGGGADAGDFPSFNFFNSLEFDGKKQHIKDILEREVDGKYYLRTEKVARFLREMGIMETKRVQDKIVKLFDLPKTVHNDMERQRRVYSIYGISPTVLARSDTTKIYLDGKNLCASSGADFSFGSGGDFSSGSGAGPDSDGDFSFGAIRKFTPAENFRIQGFDRKFVKNATLKSGCSDTQLYKQAGNAVSPLVVAGICKHLFGRKWLSGRGEVSGEGKW